MKGLGACGAQGPRRGRHARGRSRGFCLGFSLPRRVPLPAPGPRVRLTLQNDLLERLPLQSVPAPQFLRDVTLPAGKVCGAEARRHAECCPGASGRPIRADTGAAGCSVPRAASEQKPAAGTSLPVTGHPGGYPGRLSGLSDGNDLGEGRKVRLVVRRRRLRASSPETSRDALK